MTSRKLAAIAVTICLVSPALARQADEKEAVLETIQQFFDTMAAADTLAASRILLAGGAAYASSLVDGRVAVRTQSFEEYLSRLSQSRVAFRERMFNADVTVENWMAVATTPYDFHIDGEFSHCGTDVFVLLKVDDAWKIASVTYTVERTGCATAPDADSDGS